MSAAFGASQFLTQTVTGSGIQAPSQTTTPPSSTSFQQSFEPNYVGPGTEWQATFGVDPSFERIVGNFARYIAITVAKAKLESQAVKMVDVRVSGQRVSRTVTLPRQAPSQIQLNEYTMTIRAHGSPVTLAALAVLAIAIIAVTVYFSLGFVRDIFIGKPPQQFAPTTTTDPSGNTMITCPPGSQLSADRKACIDITGGKPVTGFSGTDAAGKKVCGQGFIPLADGSGCIPAPSGGSTTITQQIADIGKGVGIILIIGVGGFVAFKIAQGALSKHG